MYAFVEHSQELTNRYEVTAQYPDVAVTADGVSFVVWQENQRHQEYVMVTRIEKDGRRSFTKRLSGVGLALRPSIEIAGGDVCVAWSQFVDNAWEIQLSRLDVKGNEKGLSVIERGEALFYPYVTQLHGEPVVLFSRQTVGQSKTIMAVCHAGGVEKTIVSATEKTYRPSGIEGADGSFFVCYDTFNGKSYDVLCRMLMHQDWTDEVKLNKSGMRCAQPMATRSGDTFVVGWYENGASSDFAYVVTDVRLADGRLAQSNYHELIKNRNWYNNVDACCNRNGVVVFTYTIGKSNMLMRYRHADGSWSNPVVGSFNDKQCCVRPKVSLDGDDRIHYVWQYARTNGHQHRASSPIYNVVPVAELDKHDDGEVERYIDRFVQPIPVEKEILMPMESDKQAWLKKNGLDGFQLLFGDIHGQSNMSDGMGELDQYYHYARVDAHMDFCALTDHDCYPDVATDSEWEWNRTTRNLFDAEKNMVVLLAYEWTSNEYKHDFGHKNVYYPGSAGGLYTSCDSRGLNPDRLYASIKKDGGQCIPHHVAADWGSVSAATDWDYHDPEATRISEIYSRHADYERDETTSRFTKNIAKFPHTCVQDALKRGYRLGFIAGSDSHQMEHGKEGGILGAFMTEKSSQALWQALWDRRVYATTGDHVLLAFRINGRFMGEELSTKDQLTITASVLAMHKIRKVEIIKNNAVFYTAPASLDGVHVDFTITDTPRVSATDYYYLRVEEEDDQCAWSSPIWVN